MSTVSAQKGHMKHSFDMYPAPHLKRSKFDRSHALITTFNAGLLIPIWHDQAYPGDTLILSTRSFTRMTTQKVPFMSNVYMDVHFWCVPNRLLWSHWTAMNGEKPTPESSTDYLVPQIETPEGGATQLSVYDYFNIPLGVAGLNFNAFNFRAYSAVWNEWYRDENLQDPVTVALGDTDLYSNYTLLPRGKRKDYFTSCLPWPQKADAVDLPLGTIAPVSGTGDPLGIVANSLDGKIATSVIGGATSLYAAPDGGSTYPANQLLYVNEDPEKSGLYADLSSATAATINSLRQAFAIQRMLEKDALGGTRYIEMILSHFGVKSPDARLQRPEFLGGGTFDLEMNVVPQTSQTTDSSPLADLASYGVIRGATKKIVHSFTEHCVVFGVACVRPEYYYQQGLERDYSKRSRIDYYLPVTANLGEQAVLNKEIYAQGTDDDDDVFGYQERWAEMRYKNSYVTGMARSTSTAPLDVWHLATEYGSLPSLNDEFIEEDGAVFDRVLQLNGFNVDGTQSTTPQFIANFWFDEQWVRPMPVYSVPSSLSHF